MSSYGWDCPNPVFLDYETQSAANIKEVGGRLYAEHPSTRVLILVACIDGVFHVWIPDHIRVDTSRWMPSRLWPHQLKRKNSPNGQPEIKFYRGNETPDVICRASESCSFVAHNAYGFDQHIWERFNKGRPQWLDNLYAARVGGRPGQLDKLGKALGGPGKDRAKKLLPLLTTATSAASVFDEGYRYPVINSGDLEAFTRYAVGDVEIMIQAWDSFDSVKVNPAIIHVSNRINERGVKLDTNLTDKIEQLSAYSVSRATTDIEKLTKGVLHEGNLRSGPQVHAWLDRFGVRIHSDEYDGDGNKKKSLRKEHVQRLIDSPYVIDENLLAVTEVQPVVLDVLKLRMKALRITGAKVDKARQRLSKDGRIRDAFAYHLAHTGRYGSLGYNIQNLPRPHELLGEPYADDKEYTLLEELLARVTAFKSGDIATLYAEITGLLPEAIEGQKFCNVDDVNSALLRLSFIPEGKKKFAIADYAQIECRIVAWMANQESLIEAFRQGRDIYREFAAILYGVPLEQVTKAMRQVSKQVVLGCGYGMAAPKFRIYAANNGIDLVKANITADECIDTFRDTYTKIAGWKPPTQKAGYNYRVGGLWKDMDKAVRDAVNTRTEQYAGRCLYNMQSNDLICTLPSGREITYPNARMDDVIPPYCYTLGLPLIPKATVVFDSNRGTKSLYGGLETENADQGIAADCLKDALIRMHTSKMVTVVHAHDEIVNETSTPDKTLREMIHTMSTPPEWARGCPISAEGFVSPRWTKKPLKGYKELKTKDVMKV